MGTDALGGQEQRSDKSENYRYKLFTLPKVASSTATP